MKHILLTVALLLAFSGSVYSQSQEEKKTEKKPETSEQSNPNEKKSQRFVDANGDGIDDRKAQEKQEHNRVRTRKRDRFVDTDGDGINDDRCNGLGFGSKKGARKRGGQQ